MRFDPVANFVFSPAEPPETALRMAATLLIDTLGVAAGAAGMEAGRIARAHALAFHAAGADEHAAHILFDGRRASIPGAAFAAATQIDNLDAHDGFNPTKGHVGCAVVPALFAFAEAKPELSARTALAYLVMSYEVAARAAFALHASVEDYHTSGAWNALGVAALACRLMDVDRDTLRQALGIAEYHGPRSQMMREIAHPTMLHDGSGMGALVGSMAALMAERGFIGAPAVTVEAETAALHWADLGTVWTVEQNYIKPYPICRWAHAALDALSDLMKSHPFRHDELREIEVNTFAESAALYPGMPETTSQAQYSLRFALATLLVKGQIGPKEIGGAHLSDAEVARILPLIRVREDPRHSARFPAGRWSDVTVHLQDGRSYASGEVNARGGPEAPMADAEIEAKFRLMTADLPDARVSDLWTWRDRMLDPAARFEDFSQLVRGAAESDDG
ncbi:MAG: MmgE/PrpD family protein [Pseudomonadota bacterium]